MATLWHVGDVIELICEFDDIPTQLTTLRRVSWSFHRAVENVWTLLLGRQNSVIGYEHADSIVQRYEDSLLLFEQDDVRYLAARAALTALRHTLTSFAWPRRWSEQSMSGLSAMFINMPQLQSVNSPDESGSWISPHSSAPLPSWKRLCIDARTCWSIHPAIHHCTAPRTAAT
jgi:hypothetical protein